MNALLRALHAERLKLRHTLALWMVLVAPLAVALLCVLQLGLHHPPNPPQIMPEEAWNRLGRALFGLWSFLMLPLYVTLQSALLAGLEHGNKQWKHLLALPLPRGAHYLAKFVMVTAMVVASYAILLVLLLLSGRVLALTAPWTGLTATVHVAGMLWPMAASCGAALLMTMLQTWVALRWRSFALAVGFGMVATVAGFIIGQSRYGHWYPWSLPLQAFSQNAPHLVWALQLGLIGAVLAAGLAVLDLCRREAT